MTAEVKNIGDDEKEKRDSSNLACEKIACDDMEKSDEDYWEEMLFISRGPNGWNIGCGCG